MSAGIIVPVAMDVVGAGKLIGAQVSDAPRREQLHGLQGGRQRLFEMALTRPEHTMLQVPIRTLAAF